MHTGSQHGRKATTLRVVCALKLRIVCSHPLCVCRALIVRARRVCSTAPGFSRFPPVGCSAAHSTHCREWFAGSRRSAGVLRRPALWPFALSKGKSREQTCAAENSRQPVQLDLLKSRSEVSGGRTLGLQLWFLLICSCWHDRRH